MVGPGAARGCAKRLLALCSALRAGTCVDAEHPARYPPINAWDHLMQRHARSVGHKPLAA